MDGIESHEMDKMEEIGVPEVSLSTCQHVEQRGRINKEDWPPDVSSTVRALLCGLPTA